MLEISKVIQEKDKVIQGLLKRNIADAEKVIESLIQTDKRRRETQQELDSTLNEANTIAKSIGMLMKQGKKDDAEGAKAAAATLKEKSRALNESLNELEEAQREALYNIPNVPNESVPEGKSEDDNEVMEEWGQLPSLHSGAQPHWDLIKKYDIIDFDLGNKITGAGFPVYKGKGARLQRALVNYFLDFAVKNGYQEIQPPILINEDSGLGTGQLPDKEGQMYGVTDTNLYLIPTAEVPITNLYRNVILSDDELPIKNVGFTPCFRREAGSWGAHVRGLNRLHQFDKVEIVQVCKPEESPQKVQEMCDHVKELLESLGLPYRLLKLCVGDLGFTSTITFDMEVYSAAQEKWLEVSSVSNFETYQANRLKLRYKEENKKTRLLHTLNGSALALPRIMAAILENNQTEEGIQIPEVLRTYTGFDRID